MTLGELIAKLEKIKQACGEDINVVLEYEGLDYDVESAKGIVDPDVGVYCVISTDN